MNRLLRLRLGRGGLSVQEVSHLLLSPLRNRIDIDCCASQKCVIGGFESLPVFAAIQIVVKTLRAVHHFKNRIGRFHEFNCLAGTEPHIEVGRHYPKGFSRTVLQIRPTKCIHHRAKSNYFAPQGYRDSTRSHLSVFELFCFQQSGSFILLYRRLGCCALLAPKCDGECHHCQNSLSPCCPLTLTNAERSVKPAAIVHRIGHSTSPVLNGAIVFGRGA